MATDIKQIAGTLDLDSSNETIQQGVHKTARNVTFRGPQGNKRVENIIGNRLLDGNIILPLGNNLNLGRFYDPIKKRIYFFNFNSDGKHGIYLYNTITQIFQRIVEVDTNTNGDVLQFDADHFISNVNIIYGDSIQGDQLCWLNCQGKPCKVNVDRALSGGYGTIETEFLDVATAPPTLAPYVVYEDDATIVVNNLRKKLFKFKTRYVYDDNEKSVTSIQSEIPLPYDPFETSVDADETLNCRIAIVYQTGPANVKKIEILGCETVDNPDDSTKVQFGDYYLITSIEKSVYSIPDNDIAVFNFYNDQAYNYIDLNESIQLFDWVPLAAVAQELLNGNVLDYGNITEGYPNLTNFSNGSSNSNVQFLATACYLGRYFSLIVANQSGDSGFGTGNVHVMVKGRVTEDNEYIITFTDLSTIEYTAVAGDDITDVLDGLIADATSKGFTVTGSSATPNALYFSKMGLVLAFSRVFVNGLLENIENASDGSLMAYDWWSRISYGNVYFDTKGRTNGVVYPATRYAGQTVPYADLGTMAYIPEMVGAIYHRPPDWAAYYSWVRTKNLSKSNFLQWISDRTYKDTTAAPGETTFAYISIETINTFRAKNTSSPLIYDFAPNDRIRFIKRFNQDNSTANVYSDKDFEIQGQEINPTINGVVQSGQFVKIFLPTTDASFDFGSDAYAYYFIELYTPAESVANGLDFYYEFGERYKIGDAGLSTRFHQGQLQNQSSDLSIPATFNFIKGDNYTRFRVIQTGVILNYSIPATSCLDSDAGQITMGINFVSASVTDANVMTANSPCQNLVGFNLATNNDRWIIKIGTGTYNFRIRGAVTIIFTDTLPGDTYEFFLQKNDGTKIQLVPVFDSSAAGTYSFTYDATFTMTSGERIFYFGWSPGANDHTRTFTASTFTVTRTLAFTQTVIDPNFSDYYPSAVNSNGRAFVHDPNAAQITYKNIYRWSLAFQESTSINQTNRFYPLNFDTVDLSKGGIIRFRVWEKILRIYQERKCGRVGIYQKFITQADGATTLITSNEIITKNNVQYYEGDFGIGNQADSLVSSGFRDYIVDPIKGVNIRLSMDGIEVISELYKAQTEFGITLPKYQVDYDYQFGGISRITGVYNIRKDLPPVYMCIFQGGVNGDETIPGQAIIFNEAANGYEGYADINPDSMVCAENTLYAFYNGKLYIHDNTTTYANFFGEQKEPSITFAFNKDIGIKKVFNALAYESNVIWVSPITGDIYTSMVNPQTGFVQQSQLKSVDYEIQENIRYAAFLRDTNSGLVAAEALVEGDVLTGNYIIIKLVYQGSSLAWVYLPYVNYELSNRNF